MTQLVYLLDIAAATTARELHELKRQADTDADLSPKEREQINNKIAATFGAWNLAAVGKPQPRWR